jgi:predicted DNA-binding transcriptional regulator YafY
MSLRQRLLTAAGRAYAQALARSTRVLGQARGAVLRQRPEERLFRRRGRLGIITDAIENKQQLTFWYDNTTDDFAGQRLGDPYGVYQRGGQTYLLCWVTPPTASATPQEVPGWRLFIMSRIRNPRIEVNLDRSGKPKPFRVRRGYRRFREGRFTIKVRQ